MEAYLFYVSIQIFYQKRMTNNILEFSTEDDLSWNVEIYQKQIQKNIL